MMNNNTPQNDETMLNLAMIIDDHDISNFMAQQVLINSKIAKDTIIQPAGFSAINYLERNHDADELIPEIIFLDLDMPVVSGIDFLERFMLLPLTVREKSKIVILSGYDKRSELQKWVDNGTVIYYILKPLKPGHLRDFKASEVYQKMIV